MVERLLQPALPANTDYRRPGYSAGSGGKGGNQVAQSALKRALVPNIGEANAKDRS